MSTTKEQTLEAIRKTPKLRNVQIADAIDCDIDEVNTVLRELVQSTQLLAEKVEAPNGLKDIGYSINPAYLGWTTGAPAASNPNSSWRAPGKGVEQAEAAGRTKVQMAIDYLTAHDTATDDQLRDAMGLETKYTPSQYLGPAVKSGRITRDGKNWRLGTGVKPVNVRHASTQTEKARPPAPATGAAMAAKLPRKPAPPHIPQNAVVSSLAIGDLQIIEWQAGNLVISANDNTVDLKPAQVKALTAFVTLTQQ
jgi:hypothetical protein